MKTRWIYDSKNVLTNLPVAELKKDDDTHILSIYENEYHYSVTYSEDFQRLLQYFAPDHIRVDQILKKRGVDISSLSDANYGNLRLKVACELIEQNFHEQIKNISKLIS